MAVSAALPAEPLMETNTTPLIDVMLVLIIMLIITIPMQQHAVTMDLPSGIKRMIPDPIRNIVGIERGGLLTWNGQPVSPAELSALLNKVAQMAPAPEVQLRPDPIAPYRDVDQVLVSAKRAGVPRLGFVGNEAYRHF